MMALTRREVVLGGALTIVWTPLGCGCAEAQVHKFGCLVPQPQQRSYLQRSTATSVVKDGTEKLEPRSNSPALDYALAQALARMVKTFGVLPAFSYYHEKDGESHNALATSEALLERVDGTVLFGLGMLGHLLDVSPQPDAAIVAVCAHEFGHIAAIKRKEIERLVPDRADPFRGEQHADFVAGFYAGLRARENKDYPALFFATTLRSLGGKTRGSHGTEAERGFAVVSGFKAAKERNLTVDEGLNEAFNFAMSRA
jgi:hypothetical protein